MSLPRLIVVGPLPPPLHGVTISTGLVLANRELHRQFAIEHVDTSDHRSGENLGRWDLTNVALASRSVSQLVRRVHGRPGLAYLPVSQNVSGFLRDSLMIRLAAARGWKVAAHLRGSEFRSFRDCQPPWRRRWIDATLRRIDSIAVMGDGLRWVFAGLLPADRIAVVANGTPDIARNGAPREEDTVLFLSNLRRRKGVVESVETALAVLERRPSARFLFVGAWEDTALERELRQRAAPSGDRVRFLAPVSGVDKDALLARASMLLFPPVEPEGHPRVVLEAIAAGLPVVTTRRGAIPETVIDGDSGFVLDDPVPEALAASVLRLLEDGALRARMGARARELYLAEFTEPKADRRLADWLRSVAAS